MERESLLLINVGTIAGYAIVGHLLRKWAGLKSGFHIFHYIVPALVVLIMFITFSFMRGVTTAQYAAGDPVTSLLLTLWMFLWPAFLFGLLLAGAFQLAWGICALFRKGRLVLAPLAFLGVGLCGQTFYTVAMHFPSV